MSRNADNLDNASELSAALADAGVKAVQQRNKPEQVQNEDGTWPFEECVDCGEDIPEPRLKLGRVRCVECQTVKEKRYV